MRSKAGETAALEHALKKTYGQRGVDYVKEHGYSKAMKKDLMRRYASGELKFAAPPSEKLSKGSFLKRLNKKVLERREARAAARSREKSPFVREVKQVQQARSLPAHLQEFRSRAPTSTLSKLQQMARKLVLRR